VPDIDELFGGVAALLRLTTPAIERIATWPGRASPATVAGDVFGCGPSGRMRKERVLER
jgi:hypothetical protein